MDHFRFLPPRRHVALSMFKTKRLTRKLSEDGVFGLAHFVQLVICGLAIGRYAFPWLYQDGSTSLYWGLFISSELMMWLLSISISMWFSSSDVISLACGDTNHFLCPGWTCLAEARATTSYKQELQPRQESGRIFLLCLYPSHTQRLQPRRCLLTTRSKTTSQYRHWWYCY